MTADPFTGLRAAVTAGSNNSAIRPDPTFAAGLRAQLSATLGITPTHPLDNQPNRRTPMSRVIPYLAVHNGDEALRFYEAAFGADIVERFDDSGKLGHATVRAGHLTFYVSDEYPEAGAVSPRTLGGSTTAVVIELERPAQVDELYARAVAAGAVADREPADQFHGNRSGWLRDPFGHRWSISAPLPSADSAPTTVHELGYFTVATIDPQKASAFYGALFGWRTEPQGDGVHVANTKLPFGIVPGWKPEWGPGYGKGSITHWVSVPDADAARARVVALGGDADEITASPSGRGCACRDDQGIPFELWEPAPGY